METIYNLTLDLTSNKCGWALFKGREYILSGYIEYKDRREYKWILTSQKKRKAPDISEIDPKQWEWEYDKTDDYWHLKKYSLVITKHENMYWKGQEIYERMIKQLLDYKEWDEVKKLVMHIENSYLVKNFQQQQYFGLVKGLFYSNKIDVNWNDVWASSWQAKARNVYKNTVKDNFTFEQKEIWRFVANKIAKKEITQEDEADAICMILGVK